MPDLDDTQPNKFDDSTSPITEPPISSEDTPASGTVAAVNLTGVPPGQIPPPPPPQQAYNYEQGYNAPGPYRDNPYTEEPYADAEEHGLQAPPRILFFGVIGLFMLGIIGFLGGVVYFREGLTQGQQQRVVDMFPFMETFQEIRPTPEGGIIQRAEGVDEAAADDLLNSFDIGGSPVIVSTPMPEVATEEVTPEAIITEAATPEVTAEATDVQDTPEATPEAAQPQSTSEAVAAAPTEASTLEVASDLGDKPSSGVTVEATPDAPAATAVIPPTQPTVESIGNTSPAPAANNQNQAQVRARTWQTSTINTGFVDYRQTWNNCGPASISVALSYYGWTRSQDYAESYLKPNQDDKNVSPQEMVDFVNNQSDVQALWRMGGDMDLLRTLISNEFPVIIERGQRFEGTDWLGHYQALVGYDDIQGVFYAFDTFLEHNGNSIVQTYTEVETHWREFNYIFIVVYEPARESQLMQLLGDWSNPTSAAEIAFNTAQDQARADRQDAHAWFNMGTSLTQLGRFEEAAIAYDRALELGMDAWRILWYQFGALESYYEVGRYQDVIALADAQIIYSGGNIEELYYWRGRALAAQGRSAEARTDFNRALGANRNYAPARAALDSL